MAQLKQDIRFGASADGVRIAFATLGQGPTTIRVSHFLTHLDFDLNSPVWRPWLVELSRDRRLLRYDGRGCGLSDPTTAPLGMDVWLTDLETVIDAAGVEQFALFGCSQGAAVAIAYAVRHPQRVTSLVLLGGYARGLLRRNGSPEQLKEFRLMLDLVQVGWGRDNPAFRQVFTSLFIPGGTQEQMRWFNELERLSCSPQHAVRTIAAFGRIDVSELATRLDCPTLVLHSRGDARVPFEEGRRMAGLIRGARFIPLESSNHVVLEGEPAFAHCFGAIAAFLATHDPGAPAGRGAFPRLTPREREVLELLARGLDNLQIAAHLEVSEKTVRNKVSSVFDKLDVASRAQAIVRAREAGFGGEARRE